MLLARTEPVLDTVKKREEMEQDQISEPPWVHSATVGQSVADKGSTMDPLCPLTFGACKVNAFVTSVTVMRMCVPVGGDDGNNT